MRPFPILHRLRAGRSATAAATSTEQDVRALCKRAALALSLAVATLAGTGCVSTTTPPLPIAAAPFPTEDLPAQCVVSYAALLDLADLATRYGHASSVFLDALGNLSDKLSDCLTQADGPHTPSRQQETLTLHPVAAHSTGATDTSPARDAMTHAPASIRHTPRIDAPNPLASALQNA